jgi:hypothetical protein
MKLGSGIALLLAMLIQGSFVDAAEVKIDVVSADYTPRSGSPSSQSVYLRGSSYEVNPDLGRARIQLRYDITFQAEDDLGPESSQVMVPGLTFDKATSQVVYKDSSGNSHVCATVKFTKGLFGKRTKIQKTKNCQVVARSAIRPYDDGWKIHSENVLEVYLVTND